MSVNFFHNPLNINTGSIKYQTQQKIWNEEDEEKKEKLTNAKENTLHRTKASDILYISETKLLNYVVWNGWYSFCKYVHVTGIYVYGKRNKKKEANNYGWSDKHIANASVLDVI